MGSVSDWLAGVRQGDSVAAQKLWDRYFSRLVAIANSRLPGPREFSGEDIALSAMKSVMLGVRENRFPSLTDRDGLWPLLMTITARKSISQQRRRLAKKRSPSAEVSVEDLAACVGVEPTAEFVAEIADELDRLVIALEEPRLRQIVELKLAGWSHEEIATQLSTSTRTIIRKLNRIRQEWLAIESSSDNPAGNDS